MVMFDYAASAELFVPKRKGGARPTLSYHRFGNAAEAIRFVVEEFPPARTLGAWMQVRGERFNGHISGVCTRAPVTHRAVVCGNPGEIGFDIDLWKIHCLSNPPAFANAATLNSRRMSAVTGCSLR